MSASDIIAELPKLNHEQRREIARKLFELESAQFEQESEARLLADVNHRANENFLMLDVLEADDARDQSG